MAYPTGCSLVRALTQTRLIALALGFILLTARLVVHAHGPAPAALGILAWDGTQPSLVRLNTGLARRGADGRFRFICPALWGDDRGVPAGPLPDRNVVLAARSGLFLVSPAGTLRPHPDANASGTVLDLVRVGDNLYALRVAAGRSELLAIDAERAPTVWSDASVFFSIAADDQRLLLLRSTDLSVDWQWLSSSGEPQEAGEVALTAPVEYAFARLSRGVPYALVLNQSQPELGMLVGDTWAPVVKAASSIAGPLALDDAELLAIDGELAELRGGQPEYLDSGDAYVGCLDRFEEHAYACTREGLALVSTQGVGESLFAFSELEPPDLSAATDDAQRERCEYQWQDMRFDLLALGIEVVADSVPDADAGGTFQGAATPKDAAALEPEDAGAPDVTRRGSGCAVIRDAPEPYARLEFLLGLCIVYARRRRRSRLVS